MAITINEQPSLFCLADGRLFYRITSNNQFSNAGLAHVFVISFATLPADGDYIELTMAGGVTLIFTFKTSPDNSGWQIPIGGATIQDFVDIFFLPAVRNNIKMYNWFDMASTTNGIIFTAREPGVYYNTSLVYADSSLGWFNNVTGIDKVERPNFELRALVDVGQGPNATNFERYTLSAYPFGSSVYIHLNGLLKGFYNRLALPTFGLSTFEDKSSCITKFMTRFAEHFGEPADTQKLTIGTYKYALPGGASKSQKAAGDLFTFMGNDYFLTHIRGCETLPNVPQILYYWHKVVDPQFMIRVLATLKDGTTTEANIHTISGATQFSLYAIDTSPENLATKLAIDIADVVSFRVWILDPGGPGQKFSEWYDYTLAETSPRDITTLLYQNSLGVYDYYTFAGDVAKTLAYDRDSVIIQKNNPTASEAITHNLTHTIEGSLTVSTGFLTRQQMQDVQELLRSPDIYRVDTAGFVPVTLKKGKAEMWDTDSGSLNGLEIVIMDEQPEEFL